MIKNTNDSPSLFCNLSDMLNLDVGWPFLSSEAGEGTWKCRTWPVRSGRFLEIYPIFLYSQKSWAQKPASPLQAVAGHFSVAVRPIFRQQGAPVGLFVAQLSYGLARCWESISCNKAKFQGKLPYIPCSSIQADLPLEHNTTLPFNIYSFALASIFLRGCTYLPILIHPVCRLDGGRECLAERPFERRKRSESPTNFLYFFLGPD